MRRHHRRTAARAGSRSVAAASRRRLAPVGGVLLLASLALVAGLLAACSARATVGAAGSGGPSSGGASGAGAKAAADGDWTRIVDILAYMKANTPTDPVVVLLGGSAARESTISDESWRAQIEADKGPATQAWNMGSRNRTLAQNVAIVRALPKVPTLVYIGINLGSFTSAQKTASIDLPDPAPTSSPTLQQPHRYTQSDVLSPDRKKALLRDWLSKRYPVYTRNFGSAARVLETLINVCRTRGFYPVLFELPRDTAVIGSALKAPTARYRDKCAALSKKYSVPWVSFVSAAKLPNSNFYDLWHLVEPGRAKWQALLSAHSARVLNSAAFNDGGS